MRVRLTRVTRTHILRDWIGEAVHPPTVGRRFEMYLDNGGHYVTPPVTEILPGGVGLFVTEDLEGAFTRTYRVDVLEGPFRRMARG